MSILYHFKIKSLAVTQKPVEEIVDCSYHSTIDNFRTSLKKTNLDLSNEPAKIRIARFMELLQTVKKTQGVAAFHQMAAFSLEREQQGWEQLQASYRTGTDLLHSFRTLARNNMFYTIMEEADKVLPVLMAKIEIISVHPDAGYPRYRMNPKITITHERNFLLRTLADALYLTNPASPLYQEARKTTEWDRTQTTTDYRMDSAKVIWGFERHKGLKIKPATSKAFWKRNEQQWWSAYKDDYFADKSDNKPYELVTYDVMLHPGWEKEFVPLLDQPIESTAYWT